MTTETVTQTEADQRAQFVAGLREFATWIETNSWLPTTRTGGYQSPLRMQIDLHDGEAVAQVREIAHRLDTKADESLDDRTCVTCRIGSGEYTVIAWHRNGRPGEREAELERLRAEVAELRAAQVVAR